MSQTIADLIYPDLTMTPSDYERTYPPRKNADGTPTICVRFAPSPTGFIHIGGLYTALINRMMAWRGDGVFLLRIEDTDQKRLMEHGIEDIISVMHKFNIDFDEGALSPTEGKGDYGPYCQSARGDIYRTYAKALIASDDAYPCFCTEAEIANIRERQMAEKSEIIGYAESYAHCRNLTDEERARRIRRGDPYIIRLRSRGSHKQFRVFRDVLRGDLEMPVNNQDIVIIKGDGLPTYHFAHAVDDHLMRTSDVIRADEWISSLPIHVELFERLGFEVPRYAHLSPIMKQEGQSKRKLSKRKDPEARASYYTEAGYPIPAILDYLLTIANSNFEEWREANPDASIEVFPFDLHKSSASGALFDFEKLNNISKRIIGKMTAEELLAGLKAWLAPVNDSPRHDEARKMMRSFLERDETRFLASVPIWHEDRLDVTVWSDICHDYPFLFDPAFSERAFELPEDFVGKEDEITAILEAYLDTYDHTRDGKEWFAAVRALAPRFNYAAKPKDFKKNPDQYRGSIVHLSSYIRFAITHAFRSPDLYSIIQFIGEEDMRLRVRRLCDRLTEK